MNLILGIDFKYKLKTVVKLRHAHILRMKHKINMVTKLQFYY